MRIPLLTSIKKDDPFQGNVLQCKNREIDTMIKFQLTRKLAEMRYNHRTLHKGDLYMVRIMSGDGTFADKCP